MFALLFLVGFVGVYWKQIALILIGVWLLKWGREEWQRQKDQRATEAERLEAVRDRADVQHRQVMSGDEAGVYGAFPPAA